ncbi:MAG TPA: glycosyl hydrolase [Terriglobia bacterium]|nr:glycosyl hydrolase [Terriglobia bacterium]
MINTRCLCSLVLIVLWILSPARAQDQQASARIMIDPGQKFQQIQGFGINYTGPYFRNNQKTMFDMLIDDLGVTMFRVVVYLVYSNWEETSGAKDWEYWNDRYSSPIFEASWNGLRYLNSRGIRPMLALMGPVPVWMTDSNPPPPQHQVCQQHVAPNLQGHLSPARYDDFAEEVDTMVEYARIQAHIDFDYFSPFNETDCYPPEGPRIDPDEAPKVLEAVARRLKKEGLGDVRLAVADNAIITNDYTDPILKDDELMKQVGVFTFHTYGENSVGTQVERVKSSKYARVPVWLTEYGDLNDEDKTSENQWKSFSLAANRRALTALNQGANALFFFDAFDDYEECAKRLCFYGLFRSASHVYSPKKSYYATRQLYRFVRPGWRRIAATTEVPGLTLSAFQGPSPDALVVVGVKEGGPSRFQVELPQAGAGPTSWDLYETTRELDCQKVMTVPVQDGHAEIELPTEAIFTLVQRPSKPE